MNPESDLLFRPFTEEDKPFISSSWGRSYYSGSNAHVTLKPDEFHSLHRPVRERFLSKPTATVIVCSAKNDPWLILAWLAVEVIGDEILLHYLYVKKAFKFQGIATLLIQKTIQKEKVIYTHFTNQAAFVKKHLIEKCDDRFKHYIHVPNLG